MCFPGGLHSDSYTNGQTVPECCLGFDHIACVRCNRFDVRSKQVGLHSSLTTQHMRAEGNEGLLDNTFPIRIY